MHAAMVYAEWLKWAANGLALDHATQMAFLDHAHENEWITEDQLRISQRCIAFSGPHWLSENLLAWVPERHRPAPSAQSQTV